MVGDSRLNLLVVGHRVCQAELRDCQMTLTPEELKAISFGPKTIEFGHVSVLSVNKKCFSMQNNLPQSVLVEIKVWCGLTVSMRCHAPVCFQQC